MDISIRNHNKNDKTNKMHIKKDFLSFFKNNVKEKVNLNINLELDTNNSLLCYFEIGIDRMYLIKDLREFAMCRMNNSDIVYGLDFMYNPTKNYFGEDEEKIIDIIEEYGTIMSAETPYNERKKLYAKGPLVKRLFESLQYISFEFKYKNLYYSPMIIRDILPIKFNINAIEDKLVLTYEEKLPVPISQKGDVVFYDGNIYILDDENGIYYNKIYQSLSRVEEIYFSKQDASGVFSDLVPKLKKICDNVQVDKSIEENITKELIVKYYFDLEDSTITCDVVFEYEGEQEGKFVVRDEFKEKESIYRLYSNYFDKVNSKYIFTGNDEQLYYFLGREINRLKNIGEVYYSDRLKEKKVYSFTNIKIGLGKPVNHYLDFTFKIDGVDKSEYKDIINAFKSNRRFYKLKNGSFINLEEVETVEILKLLESLGLTPDDINMKIHTSKAIYLNNLLTEDKLPYIEGIEHSEDIINRFKNRNNIKLEQINNLNAKLRDYQLEGINWLETVDTCGFGGILADEMGLGKTVQTIGFISNKKNKKTLIITPTSLIYNWKSEFNKFAPSIKIGIAHGSVKEREKIINSLNEYDVILTSYGAIKNDLEKYEKIQFDYCIIDEAQNIKNPMSKSTDAVKSINAKTKFALTGTPLENNLQELWSIFDFIMPGYLYNLSKFSAIFIRYNDHNENLKKMIKPFILRRTKVEVIKELPPKIEKKYLVELSKEQRKIYAIYIDNIKKILNDKKEIKDKISVFAYLTKLRQICLDPSVVVDEYKGKSAKTDACINIIKEYIETDNKILVFSQFTSVLKNIGKKLEQNNISYFYLDGQTKSTERIKLVDEFNAGQEKKVFLISLKAGGTGLNLTSANLVIHFDPWWNPSVENQASDRAHRYGQKSVVEVIKLIAKDTIEEKIVELQDDKKKLIEDIIDGGLSDYNSLKQLSDEELIELFK